MNDFIDKIAEFFKSKIRPDQKIIIKTSNETMHLDLETGEMVSDSYTNEVWNYPPEDHA